MSQDEYLKNQGLSIEDVENIIVQIDKAISIFLTAVKKETEHKKHYEFVLNYLKEQEQKKPNGEYKN